jgi:hypothetical protein
VCTDLSDDKAEIFSHFVQITGLSKPLICG